MGEDALRELADGLTSAGEREMLSDKLLRLHRGQDVGAYSDDPGSWRNKRIRGHEIQSDDRDVINLCISDHSIRRMIGQAAEAGLSRPLQEIWVLSEAGCSQREIGELLGVSHQTVGRKLAAAREVIWDHLDTEGLPYIVFLQESHRTAYYRPPTRDPLPDQVEHDRRVIEQMCGVVTMIQQDNLGKVELWRPDRLPIVDILRDDTEPDTVIGVRTLRRWARLIRSLILAVILCSMARKSRGYGPNPAIDPLHVV